MHGANKILTLSYGAFSCRIEGFEDPFNVMTALAEYFRTLATEDHLFGTSPPPPDADMMQRIAEREIRRPVETTINASGVTLRAGAPSLGPSDTTGKLGKHAGQLTLPSDTRPTRTDPGAVGTYSAADEGGSGTFLNIAPRPQLGVHASFDRAKVAQSINKTATDGYSDTELLKDPVEAVPETLTDRVGTGVIAAANSQEMETVLPTDASSPDDSPGHRPGLIPGATTANPESVKAGAAQPVDATASDGTTSDGQSVIGAVADDQIRPSLLADETDAAMERLLAQTNSVMEVPEIKRRVSAIAHLKAVVAVTLGDRIWSGMLGPRKSRREDPYREDLERVMQPRRQDVSGGTPDPAPRPVQPQPAGCAVPRPEAPPRKDAELAFDAAPVQGRRASVAATGSHSFSEFAEKLHATSPADLLEAAAAYAACVQGRPSFSRPQILRQVLAASPVEISREDQLRSFGRLLRDGRIAKLRRGQFTLTDRSQFLAEARRIAG